MKHSVVTFIRNCKTTEDNETQQKATLEKDSWLQITKLLSAPFLAVNNHHQNDIQWHNLATAPNAQWPRVHNFVRNASEMTTWILCRHLAWEKSEKVHNINFFVFTDDIKCIDLTCLTSPVKLLSFIILFTRGLSFIYTTVVLSQP